MKGFIAPLLVLMMTGMVFCQQPQPGSFAASGNRNLDPSEGLQGKLLLVMTATRTRELLEVGYLVSDLTLQAQREVDHVEFRGDNNSGDDVRLMGRDISHLSTFNESEGRLSFSINDGLIREMNSRGLSYKLTADQFQKVREVVVVYAAPEQEAAGSLQRSGATGNGFVQVQDPGPRQRNDQFGQSGNGGVPVFPENDSNQSGSSPNFNLELDRGVANRRSRMDVAPLNGPEVPDGFYDSPRNEFQNSRIGGQSFTPRVGAVAGRNTQSSIANDRQPTIGSNRQFNRLDRLDRKEWDTNLDARVVPERVRRNQQVESRGLAGFDSIRQRNVDPYLNEPVRQTVARSQQSQLAVENENYKQLLSDELYHRDRMEREIDELKRDKVAAEIQLQREREWSRRAPIDLPDRRYRRDVDEAMVAGTHAREAYVGLPAENRNAVLPRPTNRPPELAINGPANSAVSDQQTSAESTGLLARSTPAEVDRLKRNSQAIWFIMLCSVGLNFYLAMIARGFYVRYEELADEIRETFTSSTM